MAESSPEAHTPDSDLQRRLEDPASHQARFEEMASGFNQHELTRRNEDGSKTTIVAFERNLDPLESDGLRYLTEFRLRAAASGLREAFSPLVIPRQATVGGHEEVIALEGKPHRPLTYVQLGYEKPTGPSVPSEHPPKRT